MRSQMYTLPWISLNNWKKSFSKRYILDYATRLCQWKGKLSVHSVREEKLYKTSVLFIGKPLEISWEKRIGETEDNPNGQLASGIWVESRKQNLLPDHTNTQSSENLKVGECTIPIRRKHGKRRHFWIWHSTWGHTVISNRG